MTTLADAVRGSDFLAGLRPGVVALVVGLIMALAWRASGDLSIAPSAGLLLGSAVVFGLADTRQLPDGLAVGLAALGIGGLVADRLDASPLALAALVVPGAWVIAVHAELVPIGWVRMLVLVAIVVGSVLVTDFDEWWADRGAGPVLFAVTAGGVWVTVPDTEQALVLLGAAIPLALLGWPRVAASLGPGGACLAVGLVAWTAAAGGFGRLSSIIGAVASLGLLLVEPLCRWLAGSRRDSVPVVTNGAWTIVPLASAHLALVLVASRVAGLQDTVSEAAVIAAAALSVATVVGLAGVAGRRWRREHSEPPRTRAPTA